MRAAQLMSIEIGTGMLSRCPIRIPGTIYGAAGWGSVLENQPIDSCALFRDPQSIADKRTNTPVLSHCPNRLMLQLGRFTGDNG